MKKELNIMVPMRDGVRLSTDVYRPDAPGRFPVILERTPYDNNTSFRAGMKYASRGYVYVTQDVRGRYDSEGEWTPFVNEAQDGYDTQEWAGTQSWSASKICTTGGSYVGSTQWLPAPLHNKHYSAIGTFNRKTAGSARWISLRARCLISQDSLRVQARALGHRQSVSSRTPHPPDEANAN